MKETMNTPKLKLMPFVQKKMFNYNNIYWKQIEKSNYLKRCMVMSLYLPKLSPLEAETKKMEEMKMKIKR